jgi:alkylation response protein AidB-like acyl-CoA dehydrogenase
MAEDLIVAAQRIADEVLFPRALATDAAPVVPCDLLDELADAGFYGLSGPVAAGGLDVDADTYARVVEILASGCLTTTFVWVQHHGAVRGVARTADPVLRERWLEPLVRGTVRAGLAGAAGAPLQAQPVAEGWLFSGTAPWVSGWGVIDVVYSAGRTRDNRVVWGLIDPVADARLSVRPLDLVALNATATVTLELKDYLVPHERVTGIVPPRTAADDVAALRVHGAFGLGIVRRCCALLGPSSLDAELSACRAALAAAGEAEIARVRADVALLAQRATADLMVSTGSRAVLRDNQAQRLAREALFMLVYALRPPIKASLLDQLALRRD